MTANTIEQQKILYSQQVAAHTLRQWYSIPFVQMMSGKDMKDSSPDPPGRETVPCSGAANGTSTNGSCGQNDTKGMLLNTV